MEPVYLVCARDACYRDWPWLCYVNFDAVAKFDDDAQNPVLEAFGGLLEQVFRALDSCLALFGASSGFVERPNRFLKDLGMILASKVYQIWM